MSIDKAINNAAASVEIEGYHIDEQTKEWVRLLLEEKITMEEYIALVMKQTGVTA
ncbi:MAG: antitoxin VbhA family protein [Clostridia bacterium]|nr:antitoxin VbhA family protein [Clostridia bacterium]MBR0157906.1 antitoxin VbhA family protein [Clostridia bacterium]